MHKLSSCFWADSNSVSIKRTCGCRGCAVGSPPKHFGPGELLGPTDHLSRPVSVFFSPPYFPSLPCPFFISLGNKRKPSQCQWDTWWEEFLFEEVPLKSTGSVKKKTTGGNLRDVFLERNSCAHVTVLPFALKLWYLRNQWPPATPQSHHSLEKRGPYCLLSSPTVRRRE